MVTMRLTQVTVAIVSLASLALPADAKAACNWSPTLTMTPAADSESHGFDFTWVVVPTAGDCASFTIDHYRVVLKEGSYPTGPNSGRVFAYGTSAAGTALPHRAEREFYARLFACDNADCSDVFGNVAGEGIDTDAADDAREIDTTDPESWAIVGLNANDGGIASTVVPTTANDPTSFFYPPGTTHAGTLALYVYRSASGYQHVVYARNGSSGWDDFNRSTWSVYMDEAFGSHTSDLDYDDVSHPYARPVDNGMDVVVRALAQNQGTSGYWHVDWTDSVDDIGDDFDLTCSSCCAGASSTECDFPTAEAASPPTAGVAVCADSSASCYELKDALHGRWMWDYIADPVPDMTSDSPTILFSGSPDGVTCSAVGGGQADIYQATWDPVGETWEVLMDGSCPDAIITDAHDPGIIPLPNGDFKAYVVDASHELVIHYYNGVTESWETGTSVVEIYFEGDSTVVDHDCIANVDAFVHVDGGPLEGMFFYLAPSDGAFEVGYCDQGSDYSGSAYSNIYFAELQN